MNHPAFEIPNLSLVRVAGADAIKVLNGLCTAKLVDLKAGHATEAMFTDDRGRVMAHGAMALEPDSAAAWFVGQAFDAAKLAAHIDRFIFREDAQPKDVSESWRGWTFDPEEFPGGWDAMANNLGVPADSGCASLLIQQQPAWLMHVPIIAPNARLLLAPANIQSEISGWLQQCGLAVGSAAELEDRRIRNFWPVATHDMSERTLPQELDRDQRAVSFTKGCYLGQETVARLDAMGEVQKKLCLVELHGSEEMVVGQTLVRDEKEVGRLNSVSPLLHDGKRFALANMRRGSMSVGSQFVVVATDATHTDVSGLVVAHP